LGPPDEQYEVDRIGIYALAEAPDGRLTREASSSFVSSVFDLVLVFRPDGVLERHAVVEVR
jgi:hypothetical protein